MTASVMSAVYASDEIFVSTVCVFCIYFVSFATEYISISIKTDHDSGQSPTVILYSAVNKITNVYMLYGNCSLTSRKSKMFSLCLVYKLVVTILAKFTEHEGFKFDDSDNLTLRIYTV